MTSASLRFPALFERLNPARVAAVDQSVAAQALEGWRPDEADIAALVDIATGTRAPAEFIAERGAHASTLPTGRRTWGIPRPYLVPGTAVLRNHFGFRDAAQLRAVEFAAVGARLVQIHLRTPTPLRHLDAGHILGVHGELFGDVFGWAGQTRIVELSKNGDRFAPVAMIERYLREVEIAIAAVDWPRADPGRLAYALSAVYVTYNHAHPFREGNGRTGTTLLHQLCASTDHRLDLAAITPAEWIAAARDSSPFRRTGAPNPRPLVPVIRRALCVAGRMDP